MENNIIAGCLWVRYSNREHLKRSLSFWKSIPERRDSSRFNLRVRLCFRESDQVYTIQKEFDMRAFAEAVEKYKAENVKLVFDDGRTLFC